MLCILTSVLHHYLKIDYTEVGEIIVIRWSIFEGANLVTSNVCEYWKYHIPILHNKTMVNWLKLPDRGFKLAVVLVCAFKVAMSLL